MVKTAVILAAGNGTRLRRISGSLPKPLVCVAGVPLIERVMRTAMKAGLLFQLSSILDGSDGEVAKLRMNGSGKGEWIDTIVDCLTYLAFAYLIAAALPFRFPVLTVLIDPREGQERYIHGECAGCRLRAACQDVADV